MSEALEKWEKIRIVKKKFKIYFLNFKHCGDVSKVIL
jgi:hypothetical protein